MGHPDPLQRRYPGFCDGSAPESSRNGVGNATLAHATSGRVRVPPMKVGIVVPYSWSFWGGVVEHAENQALALRELGVETRTIIGNDPPGGFTRALHPRSGRHGEPPASVL